MHALATEHTDAASPTSPPRLQLVVPCFNEAQALPLTARTLAELLSRLQREGKIAATSAVLLVDDGSQDDTWALIERLHAEDPRLCGIKLGGNVGHQRALLAGLMQARQHADCTISLDADLQDDISVVDDMLRAYHAGAEVVYGVRNDRSSDSLGKRLTAVGYYRLMHWLGTEVIHNHADFRLLSRHALDYLASFPESNLFLRGLLPLMRMPSSTVFYRRLERHAGESKYSLGKMLSLAWEGVTSFTVRPLRLISAMGAGVVLFALLYAALSVVRWWQGENVPGWTSIAVLLSLVSGLQLLSLGVIGEYIGKIYTETKRRPRYFIRQRLGLPEPPTSQAAAD